MHQGRPRRKPLHLPSSLAVLPAKPATIERVPAVQNLNFLPDRQNYPVIALGRSSWLFAGSLRAGKRAAAVMSLVHSTRLIGHDPYAYLRDVLERLPTQPASHIDELLPHRWQGAATTI